MRRRAFIGVLLVVAFYATTVQATAKYERIVSLAPQLTEILYALGLGDSVVGVSTFSDYPPEAQKKPRVGGMASPSLEAVVALQPDIVVVSTDGNRPEFNDRLVRLGMNTYVFDSWRIAELPGAIRSLGGEMGVPGKAGELAAEIEGAVERFRKKGQENRDRQKVLFIVWPEPLIVAGPGTGIDDAISLLGHDNIAADGRLNYPKYSIEEVIAREPDIIVVGGMGGSGDIREGSAGLLKRLRSTPAVRNRRVYYVGDGLFRLGPRVVDGIEELSHALGEAR